MLGNPGTYANKKRKKPVLKQKKVSEGNAVVKSNPSKRHRDRLNGELDRLMDLLPFPEEVCSRLDKLSVLRLSVGYLRVKSYFRATTKYSKSNLMIPGLNVQDRNSVDTAPFTEGDLLLQALNGFVMVVTSAGSVFYASPTVKDYLGFHQSDVVHQSVYELIHTDDRALFREQLHFSLNPPVAPNEDALQNCGNTVMYNPEHLPPENSSFLERSFVCRFRCLLDNSSGFLALKFQGRLKYLHGQSLLTDIGPCNRRQLALFAIALPVQPPSIVEIRAKVLLFQTKHKLDFTPTGIDSRGKVVLGYSEIELCMKGSGYQFIHAADMMHCADNHIRMLKTGESGLTVFRLLSKPGSWLWVKSNAKLIYKGGRPEFIIANQRAISNAEGEDYLRQRSQQLPFSFTKGEATLYNTGPTVDIPQFQSNKMFSNSDMKKDVVPGSLLDCFLSQDETAYTQMVKTPLPVDQVFMDSRALVSVVSDAWQGNEAMATTSEPVVVKEETKQSVMAVIDTFEKMSQNGDFCAALQTLEVDNAELIEWENALKCQEDPQSKVRSDLDNIVASDIFDYIDSILFKEEEETCLDTIPPNCLTVIDNHQQDPFTQAAHFAATELCEPRLLQAPSPDCTYSPVNGLHSHQQDTVTATSGQSMLEPAHMFSCAQKLSHQGGHTDTSRLSLQQLQLHDIFSPSIELPELTVPDMSADDALAPFHSHGQASHMGFHQEISVQQANHLLRQQNSLQAPAMAGNCQIKSSVPQPNNTRVVVKLQSPAVMDSVPPLIPCNDCTSTNTPNIPFQFSSTCLQENLPFEKHNRHFQQWAQIQQQKLPHTSIMQNGHKTKPALQRQNSHSQALPCAVFLPRSDIGLNQTQQGGLADTPSSCMLGQHFSSRPAGSDILPASSGLAVAGTPLDPSSLQGSCCFQRSHSESVVGSSAIIRENVNNTPLIAPPNMSSTEHSHNIQHYLESNKHILNDINTAERSGPSVTFSLV